MSALNSLRGLSPNSRVTFYKNENWIQSIAASVQEKVVYLIKMWDDIGLGGKPYEDRKVILKTHIEELLNSMIAQEEKSVSVLQETVNELQKKVGKLSDALGMENISLEVNSPILVRERHLTSTYKKLQVMVSERLDRFKSLVADHHRLSQRLGQARKNFSYDLVPSVRLLNSIEQEVELLLEKIARQYAETCNHKIPRQVLESDDSAFKQSELLRRTSLYGTDSLTLNEATFLKLRNRVSSLRASTQLGTLKESITSRLADLHKLFDECLVDFGARKVFPRIPFASSINEAYLETLENQIKYWEDYRSKYTGAIAAFYSWRASFTRLLQVEGELRELEQHGRRDNNQSKEAEALRGKILPQLEEYLFSEAQQCPDFKIFGCFAKAYIEEVKREVGRFAPGSLRLSSERRAQLQMQRSPQASRTKSTKTKTTQPKSSKILKSMESTTITRLGDPSLQSDSSTQINSTVLDMNQSACSHKNIPDSVVEKAPSEEMEWPGRKPIVPLATTPVPSTPSRLRAQRVGVTASSAVTKKTGLSASCGQLSQIKTPRAVRLLQESKTPISVVDLFLSSQKSVAAKNTTNTTPLKQQIPSCVNASSVSLKSDSVFATPIGRAPVARKKPLNTHVSASCSRLDQIKLSSFESSTQEGSDENDENTPISRVPVLKWPRWDGATGSKTPNSSVAESLRSVSPFSVQSDSAVFATPVRQAPVSRVANLSTTALNANPSSSRLRAPRVGVNPTPKRTPVPSALSRRRRASRPSAVRRLQEARGPISILEVFGRDGSGGKGDATSSNKTAGPKTKSKHSSRFLESLTTTQRKETSCDAN